MAALDWRGVLVGFALILVIRPAAGLIAFTAGARGLSSDSSPKPVQLARVERRERLVTAFFGVRGIGSLYYLAYALGQEDFSDRRWLWSTVAFTVLLSVVLHGILATPSMRWLANHRDRVQDP